MFWLAFEARQGAEGQGTPRDDVEGIVAETPESLLIGGLSFEVHR